MNQEYTKIEVYFFIALFLSVLVLSFFLFEPFLPALAIAAVLAVLSYPIHTRILKKVKFKPLAAFITTGIVTLIVAIPASIVAVLLVAEIRSINETLSGGNPINVYQLLEPVEGLIQTYIPESDISIKSFINDGVSFVTRNLAGAFASTAQLILSMVVGLVGLYYFLKDGNRFIRTIINFSPLEDRYDRAILGKLKRTIHSVIQGSLAVAVIQGLLTGIGFTLFGVPGPVLWGTISAVVALIPGVGTGLVIFPAVLFLYFTEDITAAIGLAIWGTIAVGLIDNILLPKLLAERARIHPLLVLVAVLGGIGLFGPSGFLLGPLILSLLYGLGDIYTVLFKQHIEQAAREEDDMTEMIR